MDEKELYCLGVHFKVIYEQRINGREFNLAEPCYICKYSTVCNVNEAWESMLRQLDNKLGICVNRFTHTRRDNAFDKCSD